MSALKWEASAPLSAGVAYLSGQAIVISDAEYLYAIGGATSKVPVSTVYYAKVQPSGGTTQWQTTAPIYTGGVAFHGSVVISKQIYVIGGVTGAITNSTPLSTVFCSTPLSNGPIQAWRETTPITKPLRNHAVTAIGDRIYVIGGRTTSNRFERVVYSGKVSSTTCGPIEWSTEISLPHYLSNADAVAIIGKDGHRTIYVIGGWYSLSTQSTVYSANLDAWGHIDPDRKWYTATFLPISPGLIDHAAVAAEYAVYVIGGTSDGRNPINSVYRATINQQNGSLGEFVLITSSLPLSLQLHASVLASSGQIYVVGGQISQSGKLAEMNYVFFTPLALLLKSADPPDAVRSGDLITYSISYRNNGLRPLENLIITDAIPANTQLLYPPLPTGTSIVSFSIPPLPITGSGSVSFTVQVRPRAPITQTLDPLLSQMAVLSERVHRGYQYTQTTLGLLPSLYQLICTFEEGDIPGQIQYAESANCGVTGTQAISIPYIDQGDVHTIDTRTKPFSHNGGPATFFIQWTGDCWPGVTSCNDAGSIDVTVAYQDISTPIPVINVAWLCEDGLWCIKSNPVINTPYRSYLPIMLKSSAQN